MVSRLDQRLDSNRYSIKFILYVKQQLNNVWLYVFSAQKYGQYGPGITTPDLEDVKDSVKQGVSKVAGRLSGMASGVMTQLQV